MLMNSDFVRDEGAKFAERIRRSVDGRLSPESGWKAMIDEVWREAYQRPVSGEERELAISFMRRQTRAAGASESAAAAYKREQLALTNLCQQILCSNEFLYVD
jgi:hypothetical protein